MKRFSSLIAPSIIFVLAAMGSGAERDAFFETHCIDCHGPGAEEGGLRLERLAEDLANPGMFAKWVLVYDRVLRGERPPEEMPPPTAPEKAAFTGGLHDDLLAAERQRELARGEGAVRRMNRVEYEHTLRDLFSLPRLRVKQSLPEDGKRHGFRKVAGALDISYVQIRKYMEMADRALDEAIVERSEPPQTEAWRQSAANQWSARQAIAGHHGVPLVGREVAPGLTTQIRGNPRDDPGNTYRAASFKGEADSLVILSGGLGAHQPEGIQIDRFKPPMAGRYRVRFSLWGLRWNRTTHEFTIWLNPDDKISFHAMTLPATGPANWGTSNGAAAYEGPGVAYDWFDVEGPLVEQWPPASQQLLFGKTPIEAYPQSPSDVRELLRQFADRAFRRPVAASEMNPYVGLVEASLDDGGSFKQAMLDGYKAIFCAPDFLFVGFEGSADETQGGANDFALASRLSYFLFNSMPGQELRQVAASGELSQPKTLRGEVERMLDDPRSESFVEHFLDQWLELEEIDFTTPDPKLYAEFDPWLQDSMLAETRGYFRKMLDENLSIDHLTDSDFLLINQRLARQYDIKGVTGGKLRQVDRPDESMRGGLMTQASILKVTANGTATSPVLRGVWVSERLLGVHPDPPPDDVPSIEPNASGATTVRELIEMHSSQTSCANCHAKFDPPGMALESFDVIGGLRDRYRISGRPKKVKQENGEKVLEPHTTVIGSNGKRVKVRLGQAVDAGGELADGRKFDDINELKALLLDDRRRLARNLVRNLLIYATGSGIRFSDRQEIEAILDRAERDQYGLRSILHAVVQSESFRGTQPGPRHARSN